jgi:hypothetical protein
MTMDGATASASLMEPTLTSSPIPKPKAGYAALPDISGNSTICPAIKTMSMNDSSFTLNATGSIVDACQLADHQAEDNANMDITHDVAENNLENADISQAPFIGVNTGNGNTNASFVGTIKLNAPPTSPGPKLFGGGNIIQLMNTPKPSTSKMESTDATAPPATKTINVSNLDLTVYPSTDVSGGTPVTGIAISMADIGTPAAVEKNSMVTMLLETPEIRISVRGRALDAAPLGGVVMVVNSLSEAIVDAEVIGPGLVRVVPGAAPRDVDRRTRSRADNALRAALR